MEMTIPNRSANPFRSEGTQTVPKCRLVDLPDAGLEFLPEELEITPPHGPFDITVQPPGSKSLTNRALLLASLGHATSRIEGALLDADDARVMIHALGRLGAEVKIGTGGAVRVTGVGGRWRPGGGATAPIVLDLENAGTATRFLAAAALLGPFGPAGSPEGAPGIVIDGNSRMRQRPIRELVEVLRAIGARVDELGEPGCPPIRVFPLAKHAGATPSVVFRRAASSQFVSALLLVAPFLPGPVRIRLEPPHTSLSYVAMTVRLLEHAGIGVGISSRALFEDRDAGGRASPLEFNCTPSSEIGPGRGTGLLDGFRIEPDASGAAPLLAVPALVPGRVRVPGVRPTSEGGFQPDAEFIGVLRAFGARAGADASGLWCEHAGPLRAVDVDLSSMPDTAMVAAVLAALAEPSPDRPDAVSTLRGLRTLRVKETDRLAALVTELARIGAVSEVLSDPADEALRIKPAPELSASKSVVPPTPFETYQDHRMAMAEALIGLRIGGVRVREPWCVAKTYPEFWRHFRDFV